jgi:hypothetical protein
LLTLKKHLNNNGAYRILKLLQRQQKEIKIKTTPKPTRKIEQSAHIQLRFPRKTVNPQRVIHGKVEENKGKEKTYATTSKKIYTLIFYTFTLFYLFNFNKTTFYEKDSYFNILLVILILNIKTMYNIIS